MSRPIVVGITGASGAVYAVRLLEALCELGHEVHLSISRSGQQVLLQELGLSVNLDAFQPEQLSPRLTDHRSRLHYHRFDNFMAPIASGSHLTCGMVICPCSGTTLSGVVHGASNNLIQRAAEVHLKERRRLVLVPRETPVSLIHLDNLKRAAEAGAVVLPASPGWYHGVTCLDDLVHFIVARILDQLGIDHRLMNRWGTESAAADEE